jgi:O-methyltransferase
MKVEALYMSLSASSRSGIVRGARRLLGRVARSLLRHAPVEVFRRRPGHHYVPYYYGHSAYKDLDILALPIFGDLARNAVTEGRTFLYYDKLYTIFQSIWNLARSPGGRSGITIAEVGAFRGGGGYFMASCAEALGVEQVKLHCFDTFAGAQEEDVRPDLEPSQEAGRRMGRYRDVSADDVRRYLARFSGAVVHVGRFQDTAAEVGDECFDFVHVDINLYEPTAYAMSFLDERLAEDGILVVDDYGSVTNPGVNKAVDEFLENHTDYVRFHLLTNQCLLIKRRAHTSQA